MNAKLDLYKKLTDPKVNEFFKVYRFSDYKTQVIDLLQRVCTVSVKTMRILSELEKVAIS